MRAHILFLLFNFRSLFPQGQSPASLAESHLSSSKAAVLDAEAAEKGPWINYRATHSDGRTYGDLVRTQPMPITLNVINFITCVLCLMA
jgi:hypothetical protein